MHLSSNDRLDQTCARSEVGNSELGDRRRAAERDSKQGRAVVHSTCTSFSRATTLDIIIFGVRGRGGGGSEWGWFVFAPFC